MNKYTNKQYNQAISLKKQGLGSLRISKILKIKNRNVVEGWINKGRKPRKSSHNLQTIKKIRKIKKDSPEISYLVGLLNGDGHLQIERNRDGKITNGLISFYSKNIREINIIIKKFKKLFGIKGTIYKDERGGNVRYKLFFHSYYLAEFLESMGVVRGNKCIQKHLVPSWIMKDKKEVKAAFLRGIYSAEGSITKFRQKNSFRYRGELVCSKIENLRKNCIGYMVEIKSLVGGFDIKCSNVTFQGESKKRKDGRCTHKFRFTFEKRYFDKFYKFVGFDNEHRQLRLKEALNKGSVPKRSRESPAERSFAGSKLNENPARPLFLLK